MPSHTPHAGGIRRLFGAGEAAVEDASAGVADGIKGAAKGAQHAAGTAKHAASSAVGAAEDAAAGIAHGYGLCVVMLSLAVWERHVRSSAPCAGPATLLWCPSMLPKRLHSRPSTVSRSRQPRLTTAGMRPPTRQAMQWAVTATVLDGVCCDGCIV